MLSVPVDVPTAGARVRSAVAVHPQWWFKLPPTSVRFGLVVEDETGSRRELFGRRLNPTKELADRGWFEVDVSLDEWAGQRVRLLFVNEAERSRGETVWMGGWAVPLLVPSSAADPSRTSS